MTCSKTQSKLCNKEKCKICFERSFASYEGKTKKGTLKVELWNYELNNGINPRNVRKGSITKRWFNCDVCDHSFLSQLTYITSKKPTWCPYCALQKLCDDEKCDLCFNRSLASVELKTKKGNLKIELWNYEKHNGIKPRDIFKGSRSEFFFD